MIRFVEENRERMGSREMIIMMNLKLPREAKEGQQQILPRGPIQQTLL